jgi:hypothetical protein
VWWQAGAKAIYADTVGRQASNRISDSLMDLCNGGAIRYGVVEADHRYPHIPFRP